MKVRAVAITSERSNAVGTVELECTPHGLVLVHLGVGAFSEDYAPAALTSGTRVLVPWAAVDEATIEGDRVFLAFDAALSPHHRLLLANFSGGRSAEPETIRKQRFLVRTATLVAAAVTGLASAALAGRFTSGAPAAGVGIAVGGAVAVLMVGLLADRIVAYGGTPPDAAREAFFVELARYLPALAHSDSPEPKKARPPTLAELQGMLPRTTFTVVLTLTATSLAAVLVGQWTLRRNDEDERPRSARAYEEPREEAPVREAAATPLPPPPRAPSPPPSAPPAPATPGKSAVLGEPCRCARADSLLWAEPVPRLGILVLKQRARQGRGAPHKESVRKRYTDVDIAVVNNGSTELEEISLLVLFYERDPGSSRRTQVSSRPLFYEGPLLPGQALKWSTDAEGTEIEIQSPALGSLGPEGESAAPSDRFAQLLNAQNRPVRLHGAMMLAFLGDPRAREGTLALREALREDEAPYLGRVLQAIADLRVCRLAVKDERETRRVSGCLYNASGETKTNLGVKLRGLDGPVRASDPVGAPPNLVVEEIIAVPGELASRTGVSFSATLFAEGAPPATWEPVADRIDLLR
ncbi:MAG TPA: hypothetical protein VFZ53_01845 [Polyangiaceae bacterium]